MINKLGSSLEQFYMKPIYSKYVPDFFIMTINASKMSKYGVFSGPYFPLFRLNIGTYQPEKTPYLDTLHGVYITH